MLEDPRSWSSSSSSTPQASTQYSWTWQDGGMFSLWNSLVDTRSNDPRQYDDGWDEVIPSFDGTDFRQYERRVRLFVSNTRVAPEGRGVNFCSDSKDVPSIRVKEYRTWKPLVVLRMSLIT